jgi:hypothetical protein
VLSIVICCSSCKEPWFKHSNNSIELLQVIHVVLSRLAVHCYCVQPKAVRSTSACTQQDGYRAQVLCSNRSAHD